MFQQMQAMAQKQVIFYILTECVFFFSQHLFICLNFFLFFFIQTRLLKFYSLSLWFHFYSSQFFIFIFELITFVKFHTIYHRFIQEISWIRVKQKNGRKKEKIIYKNKEPLIWDPLCMNLLFIFAWFSTFIISFVSFSI